MELIDKHQILEITGHKNIKSLTTFIKSSPNFPTPVIAGGPGGGKGERRNKSLWSRDAVMAWHEQDKKIPRDSTGRRVYKSPDMKNPRDEDMIRRFLTEIRFRPIKQDMATSLMMRKLNARVNGFKAENVRIIGVW